MVQRHHELTGSTRAARLLANWDLHTHEMLHVQPRLDLATIVGVQEGSRVTAAQSRETPTRPLRVVRTS
jgi:glutamate synthase domain-containing protein 3